MSTAWEHALIALGVLVVAFFVAKLVDARTTQAATLAARKKTVADWRASLQAETSRVSTHNVQVRACAERAGVPGALGLGLVALGSGVLLWRRFGHSVASRPWAPV